MAPRCVILDRRVSFVPVPTGGATGKQAAEIDDEAKAMEALLQAMKPYPSVSEPPGISRLTVAQPMWGGSGIICSTDKAHVVLYAGHYGPCFVGSPFRFCYLVYDASSNSLSAVPEIPPSPSFSSLGQVAIISRGTGTYVLAELCVPIFDYPTHDGALYLWQQQCWPRSQDRAPRWELKHVRLPPQVFQDENFFTDMAFSYAGTSSTSICICWVDLFKGILVCDPFKESDDELTFVPLPRDYSIDFGHGPRFGNGPRPRPEMFRTMGCVNGVIKFVAVVGHYEKNLGSDGLVLRSWTLSPDLNEWKEYNTLPAKNIWASKRFRKMNLPKIMPTFPVLSLNEDEVVYLDLRDTEHKNVYNIYGHYEGADIVVKGHWGVCVDMIKKKVLHCRNIMEKTPTSHWPIVVSSEFTAYLPTSWKEGEIEASKGGQARSESMDHEGEGEASMARASRKEVHR